MTEPTSQPPETAQQPAEPPAGAASAKSGKAGRIALIGAALIAVAAVGIAVWRGQNPDSAPPVAQTGVEAAQPTVDEVITNLEARLKENPEDAEGWRMLGWSYFQTERFAEAATAMKRATGLDPDNPEYWSMLGEALVLASPAEGKLPLDAQQAFATALKFDPKDARARYFQAVALDLAGKHQQAIDAWFTLLKDTPSDAPWAEDVRAVIQSVGQKNGIEVASRLAAIKPAPASGGFTTDGAAVAKAGIPGPSREDIQAASALPQGQQDAMIRGMVDGLEAKLKADPNNAPGWIMLMRSRMQLGEQAKAQAAFVDGQAAFRNDGANARRIREAAATLGIPGA